jgi:hypothetical protein
MLSTWRSSRLKDGWNHEHRTSKVAETAGGKKPLARAILLRISLACPRGTGPSRTGLYTSNSISISMGNRLSLVEGRWVLPTKRLWSKEVSQQFLTEFWSTPLSHAGFGRFPAPS